MYLTILADGTISLNEADVFTSFEVHAESDRDFVLSTLGGRGGAAAEADHVFVSRTTVARFAARSGDADWEAGFAAMMTYAKSKGWTDATGDMIKAHLVKLPEPSNQEQHPDLQKPRDLEEATGAL